MIHPLPSGTRDVLPEESMELRAIEAALLDVFQDRGYGEVRTPALEYESVLAEGDLAHLPAAYRLFDETGQLMLLRTDMTIPIARVAASRYHASEAPLRFSYFADCHRAVRPQRGQPRELRQAGVELIGAAAPEGTVEVLELLCAALEATGLEEYRIGIGDAALYPSLIAALALPEAAAPELLDALEKRNFVALQDRLAALDLPESSRRLLLELPQRRGGAEIFDALPELAGQAVAGLRRLHELLDAKVARRLIFDLGLVRDIGYYTGALFEVYDPALGSPIGGGGRYDDLLGRFGSPQPAVGFALGLEPLHIALAGEQRGERGGGAE